MTNIAQEAAVLPDEPVLSGASRLLVFLWRKTWTHAAGTIAGDAEALHDMRVTLRRLGTTLANFEGSKEQPVLSGRLRRELWRERRRLGSLGDALGAVRDLDVLLDYLRKYVVSQRKRELQQAPGLDALREFLQQQRSNGTAPLTKRLQRALRPGRRHEKFARFALGLPGAEPLSRSLSEAAHLILTRRVDEAVAATALLEDRDDSDGHHELRKTLRRLRYTLETLEPCFGLPAKPYLKTLVQLQDCLGEMQDRTVLHGLASQHFGEKNKADIPNEMGADVRQFLKYGEGRRRRLWKRALTLLQEQRQQGFFEEFRAF